MANIRVGVSAAIVQNDAILLIAFDDASGPHFNLPGGGLESGELLHEALQRELHEEACAEIEIGRLLLVWEYEPLHTAQKYGSVHSLRLVFHCTLREGSIPRMPDTPDKDQVGVQWIPLRALPTAPLIPQIAHRLIAALHMLDLSDPFCAEI